MKIDHSAHAPEDTGFDWFWYLLPQLLALGWVVTMLVLPPALDDAAGAEAPAVQTLAASQSTAKQ